MLWINIECRHFDGAAAAMTIREYLYAVSTELWVTVSFACCCFCYFCRFLSLSIMHSFACLKDYINSKFVSAKRKNILITTTTTASELPQPTETDTQTQRQRLNGIVEHLNVFFLLFWLNQFFLVSTIIVKALIARFKCICIF